MIQARQILRPDRLLRAAIQRLRKPEPLFSQIGKYRVRLSTNSQVLNYKSAFHLYDTALGSIASALRAKYPTLHAIDIGANVGDTAALIRKFAEIPVLCIEGDPALRDLLAENISKMGSEIEIEYSFVGDDGAEVNLGCAHDLGNNACLVEATGLPGTLKLRSLQTILADHPKFNRSKLLKSDTEGFDFGIIQQSIEFIQEAKPAMFFEYDPHFRSDLPHAGLDTVEALVNVGYSDFIYYDNFGNFLLHVRAVNQGIFDDLDAYLASQRRHGTAIHYFDICALHNDDSDLIPTIKSLTQK